MIVIDRKNSHGKEWDLGEKLGINIVENTLGKISRY